MSQPIEGETPPAIAAFLERRKGIVVPPAKPLGKFVAKAAPGRKVNDPGAWERGQAEEAARAGVYAQCRKDRRIQIRAEIMKRRLDYERSNRAVERIGRPFAAKHSGQCVACHRRFGPRTMIAKAAPRGYVHTDCNSPVLAAERSMTLARVSVRDAVATSRYAPREASPS